MASGSAQLGSDFVNDDELATLYAWIDNIPKLSRPKRNITRDFADGVMLAEVIHFHMPKLVEIHNYQAASSKKQKKGNWDTLNKKVLRKFKKIQVPENVIEAIITCKPGMVEVVLAHVRRAIMKVKQPKQAADEEAQRNIVAAAGDYDPVDNEVKDVVDVAMVDDASTASSGRGGPRMGKKSRGRGVGVRGGGDDSDHDDVSGRSKRSGRDSTAAGLAPGGGKARSRQSTQIGGGTTKARAKSKPGGLARI